MPLLNVVCGLACSRSYNPVVFSFCTKDEIGIQYRVLSTQYLFAIMKC